MVSLDLLGFLAPGYALVIINGPACVARRVVFTGSGHLSSSAPLPPGLSRYIDTLLQVRDTSRTNNYGMPRV